MRKPHLPFAGERWVAIRFGYVSEKNENQSRLYAARAAGCVENRFMLVYQYQRPQLLFVRARVRAEASMDYLRENQPDEKTGDEIRGEVGEDAGPVIHEPSPAQILSAELTKALDEFAPVSNRLLNWLIEVLPLVILAFVLVDVLVTRQYLIGDLMLLSGLLAAAIAGFLLYSQIQGLPGVLRTLWFRGALDLRKTLRPVPSEGGKTVAPLWSMLPARWRSPRRTPRPVSDSLEENFKTYLGDFQGWLNHRLSWLLGLFFAAILALSFPYRWQMGLTFTWVGDLFRGISWVDSLGILSQIAIAYLIGLLAWRMIVIAVQVSRLGHRFDLDVQVQHPDKSGGLKPLGDLCFSNALIISILGIYLGGWIIAIDFSVSNQLGSTNPLLDFSFYNLWEPFFRQLLLLFLILAMLAFFMPLYSVHLAMIRKRAELQQMLDGISSRIDHLTKQLLDRAEDMRVDEAEQIAKEISHLQQVYQNNSTIPVWPFDRSHLIKFVSTQTIPVLGLTNIGPAILDLIKSLLGLLPS